MNLPDVVLYKRGDCQACEEALDVLQAHGVTPRCVDIDSDPELRARFGFCVPVVEINGRVRFRGRVEPVLLKRLLAGLAASDESGADE